MAHESPEERAPREAGLPDGLGQVEAVLASFAVRPAQLSAARLLYLAGQESVSHSSRGLWAARLWPAATAALAVAASVLGVLLAMRPGPQVVERIVYVQHEESQAGPPGEGRTKVVIHPQESGSPNVAQARMPTPVYLLQRELAVAQGIDSLSPLGMGGGATVRPTTYREMQRNVLEGEFGGRRKLPETNYYSWPNLILRGDSL